MIDTNASIQNLEKQFGRKLTDQEKALVVSMGSAMSTFWKDKNKSEQVHIPTEETMCQEKFND